MCRARPMWCGWWLPSRSGTARSTCSALTPGSLSKIWSVNVLAHIYAARAVLPGMLERGGGYFLQTVSAAGLLSQIGSAPYAVTKHAALALAEWISITYGDRGIGVSAI